MFQIPESAELLWSSTVPKGRPSSFPVVRVRNVVTLPGVPRFCERAFVELQVGIRLESIHSNVYSTCLFFFKTKLIVESESSESGQAVTDAVHELLRDAIVHYDEVPWMDTIKKFKSFRERESLKNPSFAARMDDAVAILLPYQRPDRNRAGLFSGLKKLLCLHFRKYGPDVEIQGFHIMCEDQFPEATQFIIDAAKRLELELELLPFGDEDVVGLQIQHKGTTECDRCTDGSPVEWTDEDWPRVLRVCPILSWSYGDVWRMLRGLCIPYCALYDMGYTSLGGRGSTVKNPLLKVVGKDGVER
ncbi:unnamed protein product [Heligmosomoides polygyrus]|uniref:FAD synthase n=1 Tax=Heligmosomoides polygyrus TaxID=6339 RepID=A0A3P7YH75_HELPZ|nr:unnamed protein product [Heligmosomoides polygyrus]